jgi:hypothetical protein
MDKKMNMDRVVYSEEKLIARVVTQDRGERTQEEMFANIWWKNGLRIYWINRRCPCKVI